MKKKIDKKNWEKPNYELLTFSETAGVGKENLLEHESMLAPDFIEEYFGPLSHGPS